MANYKPYVKNGSFCGVSTIKFRLITCGDKIGIPLTLQIKY